MWQSSLTTGRHSSERHGWGFPGCTTTKPERQSISNETMSSYSLNCLPVCMLPNLQIKLKLGLWTCPLGFLRVGALNVGVLNKTKSALANPVLSKLISQFLNSHSSCSKTLNQNGSVLTWKFYLYVKCVEDINNNHRSHLSSTVLKRDVLRPTKRTFPQENIEWLWLVRLGSWSFVRVKSWSFVGGWIESWSFVGGRVKAGTEGQLLQDPIFSRILLWVQQHLCRWSTVALSIQTSFRLRCQHLKSTRQFLFNFWEDF